MQEQEYQKLKHYAKAGKHYKERSKVMKHKLWDALKQVEKAEEDKNNTIATFENELWRVWEMNMCGDKLRLCKIHVKQIMHSIANLGFLNTSAVIGKEFESM